MRQLGVLPSENRRVVPIRRWQALFAAILVLSLLVGCAANTPLVRKDLNSISPLTVVRQNTPEMKSMGLGKALTLGILTGGIGLAVASEASGEKSALDFGKLVMDKFALRVPQDYPQWPSMRIEDHPTDETQKISGSRLEFKVTDLFIGWLGSVHGGDGFRSTTIVDMTGLGGETLWRKEFTYYSGDFKRKATIDQFLADNGRLLREEMEFAADRTVDDFVAHLKGQTK